MSAYPGIPAYAQATFRPENALRMTPAERMAGLRALHTKTLTAAAAAVRAYAAVGRVVRRAGRPVILAALTPPARRWFTLETTR